MTEKKQWFCEICTRTFDGDHAYAHVEIFLNSINKRDTGYIDQYYSDIARLGMCYNCLQEGLMIWKLHKLQEYANERNENLRPIAAGYAA